MAEHGIQDYGLAKRKAARQLGLSDGGALPSNEEVDQALIQRNSLYEPEAHAANLSALRKEALEVMDAFERFQPRLTGGVAIGAVSERSLIELEMLPESSKELEQFLVSQEIDYKVRDQGAIQAYLIFAEPVDVLIRLVPQEMRHSTGRVRLSRSQLLRELETDSTLC
jgi:hypothetical protein